MKKTYGIWVICHGRLLGRQEALLKKDGEILTFEDREEAEDYCEKITNEAQSHRVPNSPSIYYSVITL